MRAVSRPVGAVILVIAIALALAWWRRWLADDAFISLRYARNLVEGHGLVFNPGQPPVEGYTNPLWTLLMAAGLWLGVPTEPLLELLPLPFAAASLALTASLARRLVPGDGAWLPTFLLGTNATFMAFATSGLESMAMLALVLSACWIWVDLEQRPDPPGAGPGRLMALSLVLGLAYLTRPDAALAAIVLGPLACLRHARTPGRALALAAPIAVLVVGHLTWRHEYYGAWMPNTYYAKVPRADDARFGFQYFRLFLASYLLPPVLLAIAYAQSKRRRWWGPATPLAIYAAVHMAYVYRVSDYLDFRFMLPVLPLIFLALHETIEVFLPSRPVRMALVALTLAGSASHAWLFHLREDFDPISAVPKHATRYGDRWGDRIQRWDLMGQRLGEELGEAPDPPTIAGSVIGMVPYYSGLPTVDQLGLTEPWVARNGFDLGQKPGHQRLAPFGYLVHRGVDLIYGYPMGLGGDSGRPPAWRLEWIRQLFLLPGLNQDTLPATAEIVEMPLFGDGSGLIMLKLREHPAIERALAEGRWKSYPIQRRGDPPVPDLDAHAPSLESPPGGA